MVWSTCAVAVELHATDNVILTILLCTFWLKYAELKYTETVLFTSEGHITIQIFIVLP